MFTEKQLVEFGNFLFKTYDVQVHSTDGKNTPLYLRQVTDADFCNWKEEAKPDMLLLPSNCQIGENVWLQLWSDYIVSEINAVHFYEGKVKYDLIVHTSDGDQTRLYNVDSVYVTKTKEVHTAN